MYSYSYERTFISIYPNLTDRLARTRGAAQSSGWRSGRARPSHMEHLLQQHRHDRAHQSKYGVST